MKATVLPATSEVLGVEVSGVLGSGEVLLGVLELGDAGGLLVPSVAQRHDHRKRQKSCKKFLHVSYLQIANFNYIQGR